jgi:hypothetical protein
MGAYLLPEEARSTEDIRSFAKQDVQQFYRSMHRM